MSIASGLSIHNGEAFGVADLPCATVDDFRREIVDAIRAGGRLVALTISGHGDGRSALMAVVANEAEGRLDVATAPVETEYPSLTPECPQAHWFEREIFEQHAVRPVGHPWLKPIRFSPLRSGGTPRVLDGRDASRVDKTTPFAKSQGVSPQPQATCGDTQFFHMDGEEVHEVAVGPVHAGIIEPGHFRFQCQGEKVYHLEISLGYQHRGIERALAGGPDRRTMHYVETLAGDSSVAHAIAYCRAVEALSRTRVPARAQVIRGVALELERMANHIGDLGALAGDVGYLPTMSYCGRIRGDVLNMTALVCGNRFGRGLIRPGGVAYDLDAGMVKELDQRLARTASDAKSAIELLWDSPSVMGRFDQTGTLSRELCEQIGLVGVAARACGVARDVRQDFPFGIYRLAQIAVSTCASGDVFARAYVRWLEVQRSLTFVREQLESLPAGPAREEPGPLRSHQGAVALVEGWRGEVCHLVETDERGRFSLYKIVDPSFHNWFGLAMALRNQQISDFPLCNKSFNLSYCGHDL